MNQTQTESMRFALEALEGLINRTSAQAIYSFMETERRIAISACVGLRKALAEQPAQQEPVTWRNAAIRVGEDLCSVGPSRYYDMTAEQWLDWALSVVTVHAPPAQRKPLTDGEIFKAIRPLYRDDITALAAIRIAKDEYRAIEAAHGIKEQP